MKRSPFYFCAWIFAAVSFWASVAGAWEYQVIDLGPGQTPTKINDRTHIVQSNGFDVRILKARSVGGSLITDYHNMETESIPRLHPNVSMLAFDLNNFDAVIGDAFFIYPRAFLYQNGTSQLVTLPFATASNTSVLGLDLNDFGAVSGLYFGSQDGFGGFVSDEHGVLPVDGLFHLINNRRQLVGVQGFDSDATLARFEYVAETGSWNAVQAVTIAGLDRPVAYNDFNVAVAYVSGDSQMRARYFTYDFTNGAKRPIAPLATFPLDAQDDLTVMGLNNKGRAVGYSRHAQSQNANDVHAILVRTGATKNLNALIDPASGWTLTHANAINNRNEIVGYGVINNEIHGFLLEPIDVDPCPEDLNGDAVVNNKDLNFLLQTFGTRLPAADIDGNGVVNTVDLARLLGHWGPCRSIE